MGYWNEINLWKDISSEEWMDWRWQLKNAVRSIQNLIQILGSSLPMDIGNLQILNSIMRIFEMKLTPYLVATIYQALKNGNLNIVKMFINAFVPSVKETECIDDEINGIGEEFDSAKPVPLVSNFYKNRVLFFVSNTCPAYCRYCFRRRKVGDDLHEKVERSANQAAVQKAIQYIGENKEIREVIVSGGDPLILNDDRLISLLQQLNIIEHIKVLRIDTKALTTLPQRITADLVNKLKELKPLYIVGNFLHSAELTPEVLNATSKLINAGIPVLSHTALLKGINDNAEVISELMLNLYVSRIIPYSLIQFIPTKWTGHFRVPIQKGLEIMEKLHGRLSGIANPSYVVYLPGGSGKVPLLPNYLFEITKKGYYFKNFEGKTILYKENIEL